MKTPDKIYKNELSVEKSRFICLIIPIKKIEQLNEELKNVQHNYPKATHYCFACKIDEYIKFSDDGEPHGTAGKPLLNILIKEKINNVLLVVVRYYGGIQLGSGRLLRTYVYSATECIKNTKFFDLVEGTLITFNIEYNMVDIVKNYCERKGYIIENITYSDIIRVDIFLPYYIENEWNFIIRDTKVTAIKMTKERTLL